VVNPLTALTEKDTPFMWSPTCYKSFKKLKKYFILAPVLYHFDSERKIVVETEASNLIIVGILSQYNNESILHPVAEFSRKHSFMEIN
jgi:hypothetical protein